MILDSIFSVMLITASPYRPLPADETNVVQPTIQPQLKRANMSKNKNQKACDTTQGVANLPFSHGHRFCTLDEYLAHLKQHAAPIDQPWWREIRPGVYQHMATATNARPETATRAELMKRFGFSR
jgi:hypothetical protein